MTAMEYEELAPVLQAVGAVEVTGETLDLARLGEQLNLRMEELRQRVEQLEGWGLMLSGLDEGLPAMLRTAGRQYLSMRGEVDQSVLRFLPHVIDDLHARRALLEGGTILVDEFRCAVLEGAAVAHAQGLVPDAFAPAVSDRIAIDLFAASVALMSRLSAEEPAGCVAEEVLAVALLGEAEGWLQFEADDAELSAEAVHAAIGELRGLFELFQDDDVLDLFEMREPADAAVAGASSINLQMGVVDQRIEAWFCPFGWTSPTGYLSAAPETAAE
jgi:hypothetical protein